MRVCLMIEGQEGVTWDQWRALATTAEESGFEALFRSDHYESLAGPSNLGSLDAWATLNALAALTTTLRLGTLVSPVTFRHPSVLARNAVTADHVSGGRIELGMGAGWHEGEHRSFGFPFETTKARFDRLTEQVEIVYRSWVADPFDFDGRFYRLEQADPQPKPVRRPNLILGGSAGPRGAALAARWADEYNTVFPTAEQARERRERIVAACAEAGRDPITFSAMITLEGTPDELIERLRDLAARGSRHGRARRPRGDPERLAASRTRARAGRRPTDRSRGSARNRPTGTARSPPSSGRRSPGAACGSRAARRPPRGRPARAARGRGRAGRAPSTAA
jgi:alkanesulfonate monooxygenase SsuD/methylene tetrahydromethanopterin reductase-like flavin-dependent oxidoreductase (luciferase family)